MGGEELREVRGGQDWGRLRGTINIFKACVDSELWHDALGVSLPVCRGIEKVLNSSVKPSWCSVPNVDSLVNCASQSPCGRA